MKDWESSAQKKKKKKKLEEKKFGVQSWPTSFANMVILIPKLLQFKSAYYKGYANHKHTAILYFHGIYNIIYFDVKNIALSTLR